MLAQVHANQSNGTWRKSWRAEREMQNFKTLCAVAVSMDRAARTAALKVQAEPSRGLMGMMRSGPQQ
eukprot:1118133-Heterocapsa_arctica.AAC.1